ncbi:MAG: hypothetical protein QOF81_3224 [Acidimicrobiaceae bacterium]|nr:hypothetical protein [Acidimicrobiaceae bacterium]
MSVVVDRDGPYVGRSVWAGATFRVRWTRKAIRGNRRRGVARNSGHGHHVFVPRHRSQLPAYSYVAGTDAGLHIWELDYRSTTTVKRVVGNWAIGSLDAEPPDNPWSVRIRLENRTIELVATTPSRDGSTCAPPNRSSPHSPPSGFASESPRAPAPAGVAMAFKLIESTQTRWRAVSAPLLVALVRAGAVSRTPSSSNDPTSQRAVISKSRHADPLTHRPPCPPSRVQSPGIRVSAAADTGPIVI